MHDHPRLRRTAALTLSTVILAVSIPVYAAEDGVKPTYDEAYYATTDYYGNLAQGSVVKSYTANGLDRLNEARDTISSGKAELYERADLARGDLDALRDALSMLPDHIDSATQLTDDTHESLGAVNLALRDVQEQLAAVQDEVDDLYDDLDDIRKAGNATASDLKELGQHVDSLKKVWTVFLTS